MRNSLLRFAFAAFALELAACAQSSVAPPLERDAAIDPASTADVSDAGRDGGAGGTQDAGVELPPPREMDAGQSPLRDGSATDAGLGGDALVPIDAGASTPDPDAGDAAIACASPSLKCGETCVDVTTSTAHCGACSTACASGQTCSQSKCVSADAVPAGCTAKSLDNRAYLFCTQTRTWTDARRACLAAKMDLAQIGSPQENDFARQNGDSWVGASDLVKEGDWRAIVPGSVGGNDGLALTFTKWAAGEPNNLPTCTGTNIIVDCINGEVVDEDCGLVRADGSWVDYGCPLKNKYICEAY